MRLGPKRTNRRWSRSGRSRKHKHKPFRRKQLLAEKVLRHYAHRKRPTEFSILLRLINILGLVLLAMTVTILSSNENVKEILALAKELFLIVP
jgi:hypothetical protein